MNILTIFTPTYNRKSKLINCYNSLLNQTNKEFEWLIVDDGSTDNTQELVQEWLTEGKININYIKKKNGGKHSAFNTAIKNIKSKFTLIALDSDDTLIKEAIDEIYKKIKELQEDEIGIAYRRIVDTKIKEEIYDINILKHHSLKWALENNKFDAECTFIFKTDYLKNFSYPEFEEEKFFTEAYIYYQMDKPILWAEEKICVCEYQEDGLTKNILKLYYKNPKSWYLYNKMRMSTNKVCKLRIKYRICYIAFGILSKEEIFVKSIKENIKTIILYPLGMIGARYIILKNKRR